MRRRKRRLPGRECEDIHSTAQIGSRVNEPLDEDVGRIVFVVNPKPGVIKHLGAVDIGFTTDSVSVKGKAGATRR